jgi:hypothetical protein
MTSNKKKNSLVQHLPTCSQHRLHIIRNIPDQRRTSPLAPSPHLHRPARVLLGRRVYHACNSGILSYVNSTLLSLLPQPYYPAAPSSIPSTLTPIPCPPKLTDISLPTAYGFLNPSKEHARLAGYIVGIAVAQCIIFLLVRGAIVLRQRLVLRRPGSLPEKQDTREAIDA